jgi:hypothetical protein
VDADFEQIIELSGVAEKPVYTGGFMKAGELKELLGTEGIRNLIIFAVELIAITIVGIILLVKLSPFL